MMSRLSVEFSTAIVTLKSLEADV